MAALADASDLITYYDERVVCDLASDTDVPLVVGDLDDNAKVTAALDAATGKLESACLVSGLYSAERLAALTGTTLAYLKRLVCTLAMAYLIGRRQGKYREEYEATIKEVQDDLDRLRKGEAIFGGDVDAVDGGLIAVDGPTLVEYNDLNLVATRTRNFYPDRGGRLPVGRAY